MTAGRGSEAGPDQPESGTAGAATNGASGRAAKVAAAAAVGTGRSAVATIADQHGAGGAAPRGSNKIGRNDPCYCGSGKKYKRCHG